MSLSQNMGDTINDIEDSTTNLPIDPASETNVDAVDTNVDDKHAVPTVDSAANLLIRDVLGNKGDSLGHGSLYGLQILGNAFISLVNDKQAVPSKDSADNAVMRDVIGNKTDSHDGDSIRAVLHTLDEHEHMAAKVYPTGAGGETVICDNAAPWTLGAFQEIVPVNTITDDFDIHFITLEDVSAAGVYELVLYAATVEITRVRFAVIGIANNVTLPLLPTQTALQPANTQVQAKLMSSSGNADTATISIEYHNY